MGRWARVYDPRQDDTYPGGLGDHRFDDEDSFTFDRNAALNAITYVRGRYAINPTTGEQTLKVIGCGFPFDSFDWPQWVAFANICEANGWHCDGHVEADGEIKEEKFLCELVTAKDQAAQLAAYELFSRRELSGITYPLKPRFWDMRLGEAYQLIDPQTGLNHLCIVAALSKDIASATVTATFESETTAKHALALAMTGTAPAPPTLIPHGQADGDAWMQSEGFDSPLIRFDSSLLTFDHS